MFSGETTAGRYLHHAQHLTVERDNARGHLGAADVDTEDAIVLEFHTR